MRGRQSVAEPRFVATDAFAQPLEEDDGGMATSRVAWAWRIDKACMMLRFIGPALILPLADPLMSVIDTICVGKVRLVHCTPVYSELLRTPVATLPQASLQRSEHV